MDPLTIGIVAAAAAAVAGAAWLLRRWKDRQTYGGGFGDSSGADAAARRQEAERQRRDAEARQQKKERLVRDILGSNEVTAQQLLAQAGMQHRPLGQVIQDQEVIRQIAQRVSDLTLEILSVASRSQQQFDAIDLRHVTADVAVPYPTDDMRIEPLDDLEQLPDVLPEDLALDDGQFYTALLEGELRVTRSYEQVVRRRRLYILLDVSGSMDARMRDGNQRIAWAAGVALKLLERAQKGEAEYHLRYFDGMPHRLQTVKTPEQAKAVIDQLLRITANGGGTNIQAAIEQAVADIRADNQEVHSSNILVISDGESPMDPATIERRLGTDIRLHAAVIGQVSPILKQLATSSRYREYS